MRQDQTEKRPAYMHFQEMILPREFPGLYSRLRDWSCDRLETV